jgi:DNA-binding SARP family transcriptional activator/tetratricopeptide (TPR) repeat protein
VTATAAAPPPTPRLCLLDTPHLAHGAARFDLPASAPGMLLACLGVHGDWVSRERLMTLFWPDASEADAQHHLRVTLHRARQWLQGCGLDAHLASERRRLRLALSCDVPQFRAAIGQADWASAVALHRTPLLDGAAPRGFAAVDEWLVLEREALTTAWRNAALRQAVRLEEDGDAAAAATLLQALLRFDLLAEDVLQALLRVAAAAGERSTALDTFERFRERAAIDLGLEPLPGTLALAHSLRQVRTAPSATAAEARPLLPAALMAPPLVGRGAEAARLRAAGSAVAVVAGEPGVGKTRLVVETLAGATVWRCRDGLQSVPLLPAAEWLRREAPRVRQSVTAATTLRELARLEPALAPGETPPPADNDSPGLLLALCAALPRLTGTLVVDDLQWVDSATLQLLRMLSSETALRIVATLRAAETPAAVTRWLAAEQAAGRLQRIDLGPLPGAATSELIACLAGHAAPRFSAWLQRASGGNPFFALETLRALFEGGQLRAEAGGWASDLDALSADYRELAVPARVAAVVQQRLDGLSETARRALLVAALVGSAEHLEALAPVVGLTPLAMAEAAAQAVAAGLLTGAEFAHELVRDTLVQRAAPAVRRALHAGIARHAQTQLGAHALAEHWWAAGREDEAVVQTEQAAALDRARGLLGPALALLHSALDRSSDAGRQARLQSLLAATHLQAGDNAAAAHWAAAALVGAPGPQARLEALYVQAELALATGRVGDAEALIRQALAIDATAGDSVMLAAHIAYMKGEFKQAAALLEGLRAERELRTPGPEHTSILMSLGTVRVALGDCVGAVALLQQALSLARALGARYEEAAVARNLVQALTEMGRLDESIAVGRAALELGEYDSTPMLLNNLATTYLHADRLAEARPLCERLCHCSDPSLRCRAWAKLVVIHERQGDGAAMAAAIDAALAEAAATEQYQAYAVVAIAVLNHGSGAQVERALQGLTAQPLDRSTAERLDAALARHGRVRPGVVGFDNAPA